jgi:trans-aconitate methyltransferase
MKQIWQEIWSKKHVMPDTACTLAQLIALDGFNSPFGGLHETSHWLNYLDALRLKLSIREGDSIFEVGCGAGAFLYPFYQRGHPVAGIDYSERLVNVASTAMPGAVIRLGEATTLTSHPPYDVVVSNGVFLYFADYAYAALVLRQMVQTATKSVGVFDVPDLAKKEAALQHRIVTLGAAAYAEQYQGLDHLYYARDWFAQILTDEPVNITVEDQCIEGYGNSQYRFNVFIHKRESANV